MPSTKRKRATKPTSTSAPATKPPRPTSSLILKLSDLDYDLINGPEYDFVHPDDKPDLRNPPLFRSLTFVQEYRAGIEIIQSCNGLLLCRTSRVSELRTAYYVFNPATGIHHTVLPRPQLRRRGSKKTATPSIFRMTLAFEPSKSPHYKLVCVKGLGGDRELRQDFWIEIYSSETRVWTSSSAAGSFSAEFNVRFESGVYCNGSVHWLNPWSRSLFFDMANERVREMAMPAGMPRSGNVRAVEYFGESRGRLHLIYKVFEPGTACLDVFEMEEDYSGWSVKYRVDLDVVLAAFQEVLQRDSVARRLSLAGYRVLLLCVVRGDEDDEEGSYLVFYIPGKVLRYNFKSRNCYKLCDVEPRQGRRESSSSEAFWNWGEPKAFSYVESLTASV